MSKEFEFLVNIAGKVKNTKLPKTKPLWPLFEAMSNSIHSLEDRWENTNDKKIEIRIIRNGIDEILKDSPKADSYPIKGFLIIDNGVGFTDRNFRSFLTSDSDYKIEKGAKGIGRFVCLKAFQTVQIDSIYTKGKEERHRRFDFKAKDGGIFDYNDQVHDGKITGTRVTLMNMRKEYQDRCPKNLDEIAERIIEHFLVNFILKSIPKITIVDHNGTLININKLYSEHSKSTIKKRTFNIKNREFDLHIVKLFNVNKSKHEIHYCANERDVMKDLLIKHISDLEKKIIEPNADEFVYHVYITGKYLDENIDAERTGYNFASGEDDDEDSISLTLKQIREEAINTIENILEPYLSIVRQRKMDLIETYIIDEAPQFRAMLKHKPDALKSISPESKGGRLNIELYKIQNDWEIEVKELGEKFLKPKDDIQDLEEYKKNYEEYVEKFNDVGKANLAKYIVHRKSVINLLEEFLGEDKDGNFMKEDVIHNIFFPIRTYSDDISYDKQNLWLIDERLAYHTYLSSDKSFNQIDIVDNNTNDRTDLMIFNDAFAFVEDESPHNSMTIVEFKRPERNGYSTSDPKKNPIDQVLEYITSIRDSNVKDRRGKVINIDKERTPFYVYVICDFNSSLFSILDKRDFIKTPDGKGYYKFHSAYKAYIEVISYDKLLGDAKKRNRILFDNLGI